MNSKKESELNSKNSMIEERLHQANNQNQEHAKKCYPLSAAQLADEESAKQTGEKQEEFKQEELKQEELPISNEGNHFIQRPA